MNSAIADTVDFDGGAPEAEADGTAGSVAPVIGLGPEMEAEEAKEVPQNAGFMRAMGPELLQTARELFVGGGEREFRVLLRAHCDMPLSS